LLWSTLLIAAVLGQSCTNPTLRRSWKEMTEPQKQSFLASVHLF